MVEQACQAIANDVVDTCTAFIQKTAVEKAAPEMDKRLAYVSQILFVLSFCQYSKKSLIDGFFLLRSGTNG